MMSKSGMSEAYYEAVSVQDAIDRRIWEKQVTWWNGEVRVFDMWREGDEFYIAGPTEYGYRFRQIVKADGFVGVRLASPADQPPCGAGE